jgi:hypothetical protein
MISLKNKKGTQSSYLVVWTYRVVAIVLVVMGFMAIMWIRFSQPYDVRPLEATIIAKKSIECLSQDYTITTYNFYRDKLRGCLDVDEENVFMKIEFQNQNITFGKDILETYCKSGDSGVTITYKPSCYEQSYDVLNEQGQLDEINVFVAINKWNKNVK